MLEIKVNDKRLFNVINSGDCVSLEIFDFVESDGTGILLTVPLVSYSHTNGTYVSSYAGQIEKLSDIIRIVTSRFEQRSLDKMSTRQKEALVVRLFAAELSHQGNGIDLYIRTCNQIFSNELNKIDGLIKKIE